MEISLHANEALGTWLPHTFCQEDPCPWPSTRVELREQPGTGRFPRTRVSKYCETGQVRDGPLRTAERGGGVTPAPSLLGAMQPAALVGWGTFLCPWGWRGHRAWRAQPRVLLRSGLQLHHDHRLSYHVAPAEGPAAEGVPRAGLWWLHHAGGRWIIYRALIVPPNLICIIIWAL